MSKITFTDKTKEVMKQKYYKKFTALDINNLSETMNFYSSFILFIDSAISTNILLKSDSQTNLILTNYLIIHTIKCHKFMYWGLNDDGFTCMFRCIRNELYSIKSELL